MMTLSEKDRVAKYTKYNYSYNVILLYSILFYSLCLSDNNSKKIITLTKPRNTT